ncbi:MAG: hypothetical protein Q9159_003924 [Coniocarpon cinnabarinum]
MFAISSSTNLAETTDQLESVNKLKAALHDDPNVAISEQGYAWTPSEFDVGKDKTQFRRYEEACETVKAFYREQHEKQTVAHNMKARQAFQSRVRVEMTVWQALQKLDTLVDDSDPDTSLSQIEHLLQTAEAIRRDGKPRWMQLVGLIHDLGKLLIFFGAEGQWDVVGDTFPVGCAFDKRNVLSESFKLNPDYSDPMYSTECGMYTPECGLDHVMLSWGHDEYMLVRYLAGVARFANA